MDTKMNLRTDKQKIRESGQLDKQKKLDHMKRKGIKHFVDFSAIIVQTVHVSKPIGSAYVSIEK